MRERWNSEGNKRGKMYRPELRTASQPCSWMGHNTSLGGPINTDSPCQGSYEHVTLHQS